MKRQAQQALQMCGLDGQNEYALPEQCALNRGKVVHEREFADGNLDGHFPHADCAYCDLIAAVFYLLALCFREIGMSFQIPEQDVRIQQQLHG